MALGSLIGAAFVRVSADTAPGEKAIRGLSAIGSTALTTALLPAANVVAVGVGAIATSFIGAGVAAGAFGAAVLPQLKAVQAAVALRTAATAAQQKADAAAAQAHGLATGQGVAYERALTAAAQAQQRVQALAAAGSKGTAQARRDAAQATLNANALAAGGGKQYTDALAKAKTATAAAKTAQDTYNESLGGLPPASKQVADALTGLQDASKNWSASLAGSTMPIFTLGIQKIQALLPKLTPIVQSTSGVLMSFLSNLGAGTAGQVFDHFGRDIAAISSGSLGDFLTIIKNVATGFVGLLDSFTPMASKVTGGLVQLTARFSDWGATAGSNSGVQSFFASAKKDAPIVGHALEQIAAAAGHVAGGIGPLSGIGLKVAETFAKMVNALPVPVLNQVINAIVALKLAMQGYAVVTGIAGTATWLFSTATGASRVQMALLRVQMALVGIQYKLQAAWTAIVTAATWLWNTSLVTSLVSLVTSTASMIARNVVLAASAVVTGIVTAATWLWTAALGLGPLIASTAALVARNVVMAASAVGVGLMTAATFLWTVALGPAIAAIWAMTAALLLSPITWIVLAIGLLIAGVVLIATKTTWFRDLWASQWLLLRTTGTTTWGWISAALIAIGKAAGFLWTGVLRPFFRTLLDGFLATLIVLVKAAVDALGWIPFVGSGLKRALAEIDKFRDDVNRALNGIGSMKPVTVVVRFGNGPAQGTVTGHTYTSTTGYTYARGGGVGPGGEPIREQPSGYADSGSSPALRLLPGTGSPAEPGRHPFAATALAFPAFTLPALALARLQVLVRLSVAAAAARRQASARTLLAAASAAGSSSNRAAAAAPGLRLVTSAPSTAAPAEITAGMPAANGVDRWLSAAPPRSRTRSGRPAGAAARAAGPAAPAPRTVNLTLTLTGVIQSQRELAQALDDALASIA
ncbi:hypothetical protein [Streptacidiphilus sp. PAMC 29251]